MSDQHSQAMPLFKVILLLSIPYEVMCGCRWYNPAWIPSLAAAPQVDISPDNLVTVGWDKLQLREGFECVDRFDAWVEGPEGERRLCSIARTTG